MGRKKFFGPLSQRKQAKKRQKLLKMGFWGPEMPFNVCVGLQNFIIVLENVDFYNKNAKKGSKLVFWYDLRKILAKKCPKITQN